MSDQGGWLYVRAVRDMNLGDEVEWVGLKPSLKSVLMAYALRANAQGVSWPGPKRLRLDTGLSRATIYRNRATLLDLELLEIIERRSPALSDVVKVAEEPADVASRWSPDQRTAVTVTITDPDLPETDPSLMVRSTESQSETGESHGETDESHSEHQRNIEGTNKRNPYVDQEIDGSVSPQRQAELIALWDQSDEVCPHPYSLIELAFLRSVGRLSGMEGYLDLEDTPPDVPIVRAWEPQCPALSGHPEQEGSISSSLNPPPYEPWIAVEVER